MKQYQIFNREDFKSFVKDAGNEILKEEKIKGKFPNKNIEVKNYVKSRTPNQLKYYNVCLGELVKAFEGAGYEFTKDELHEMMKIKHGFTREILLPNNDMVIITKSISDASKDVNIKNMMDLIDFIIRYAAINLDYAIKDPRS